MTMTAASLFCQAAPSGRGLVIAGKQGSGGFFASAEQDGLKVEWLPI
jgi:hypothetical protein